MFAGSTSVAKKTLSKKLIELRNVVDGKIHHGPGNGRDGRDRSQTDRTAGSCGLTMGGVAEGISVEAAATHLIACVFISPKPLKDRPFEP